MTLDESALAAGGSISAEYCGPSEHGVGENTVSCGSSADATSACWLTGRSTQIACLDEARPEEQALRLIPLRGPAPAETAAAEDPMPLWLELEDGSVFASVNGGASMPPEGYLVAYTVGVDGEQGVATRKVERAWVLAGRTAPQPVETGAAVVNGNWCEAPQSENGYGCVSVALPNFTIEDRGETWPFTYVSDPEADGTIVLDMEGAPFGTYYPAGVAIPAEVLMGTADIPTRSASSAVRAGCC